MESSTRSTSRGTATAPQSSGRDAPGMVLVPHETVPEIRSTIATTTQSRAVASPSLAATENATGSSDAPVESLVTPPPTMHLANGDVIDAKNTLRSNDRIMEPARTQTGDVIDAKNTLQSNSPARVVEPPGRRAEPAATGFYKRAMQNDLDPPMVPFYKQALQTNVGAPEVPEDLLQRPNDAEIMTDLSSRREEIVQAQFLYEPDGRPVPLPIQAANGVVTAVGDPLQADSTVTGEEDSNRLKPLVWNSKRRLWFCLAGTLLVVGIVVAALMITLSPQSDSSALPREAQIMAYINHITLTNQSIALFDPVLETDASAEQITMQWLIQHDPLQLTPDTPVHQFRLQQRYAVATLWALWTRFAPSLANFGSDECEWPGVTCQWIDLGSVGVQQAITEIQYNGTGLVGTLSADVGLLFTLVHLSLRGNELHGLNGSLPDSIGLLTSVTHLDLGLNWFNGTIPGSIVQCTNLTYLDLLSNNMTGTLPNSWGKWTNMEYIDLSVNSLAGSLPESIGQWTGLKYLNLSSNLELTGSLTDAMEKWVSLEHFDVNENKFSGTLPDWIGGWTNLKHFSVSRNVLSGSLPQSVGQWTNLELFDMYDAGRAIKGSFPESCGQWTSLRYYVVGLTDWTGSLPSSIGNWRSLEFFQMLSNDMTGSLPNSIGQWTNMKRFQVGSNALTGTLPESVGSWTNLEWFSLYDLKGSMPNSMKQWLKLKFFSVRLSELTGTLPDFIGLWTNLTHFEWTGTYHGALKGTLPESIGQWSHLESFSVADKDLQGTLPQAIGNWVKLTSLNVAGNAMTGTLPESLNNWTSLELAFFDGNYFTGLLPSDLCDFDNLTTLDMNCSAIECYCAACNCV